MLTLALVAEVRHGPNSCGLTSSTVLFPLCLQIKLCDFGVALRLKDDLQGLANEDDEYVGTQAWSSREALEEGESQWVCSVSHTQLKLTVVRTYVHFFYLLYTAQIIQKTISVNLVVRMSQTSNRNLPMLKEFAGQS